jgi:uncharacterized protein (TIGR03437 family)
MFKYINTIVPMISILFAGQALVLHAQTTCGSAAINVTSDSQFLIGSSTGSSTYTFTLNGQTVASGATPQLGLYHFDGTVNDTAGLAPTEAVGQSFGPGKFGSSVGLAAGGILKYPANGNLSFTNGTIEMWIAPLYAGNSANYSAHDNSLFRYVAPNGDQLMLSMATSGVFYGGTSVGGSYMGTAGGSISAWPAWQWHHIALTYSTSAGRFRIYIDGILIGEGDYNLNMPEQGGYFTVDGDAFGNSSAFMIDEMRILNVEQTPQQIAYDVLRTSPFADDEVYLALSGLAGGTVSYQSDSASGASCGSASFLIVPLTNVNPPAGLLPTGTTSTPLTFTTSQATACRYSVGSAAPWSSMQPFDSSQVTSHSGTISGLSPDPRVTSSVYFACDVNPADPTVLSYRSVSGPYGPYPHIGSIWTGEYILTSAPAQASQIQLFLGAGFTPSQAVQIRSTNPTVLILPAINSMETVNGTPSVPASYFLRDTSGNTIEDWPGDYVLNLTNPAVVQFMANYAAQTAAQGGYAFDGVFFDNVRTTISNLTDMYGNPVAIDINGDGIADNGPALDAAWSAGVYQEIATFGQLMPNALAAGHLGATPPSPTALSALNGDSLLFPVVNVREGTAAFSSMANAYQSWFVSGRSPAITMLESSPPNQIAYGYGYTPLTAALPSTVAFGQTFYPNMRFGLANTLINDGFSAYDFGDTGAGVDWWYDEYNFNLGTPLGPATQIGLTPVSNMLTNGGFESGFTGWTLGYTAPASAQVAGDTTIVAEGNTSAHVSVTTAGSAAWQVSLEQDNVSLTAGVSYQLQFWARADNPRNIIVNEQGGAPNYAAYGPQTSVAITTSWALYTVSFVATTTANDGRIQFFMGDVAGNVWIDGVVLSLAPSALYRRDFTNGTVLLNGTTTPQTISMGSGFQRFSGPQAPMYQYIIDDTAPAFSTTAGSWSTVTYDTGYSSTGGGETVNGPYYHAWNRALHQVSGSGTAQWNLNIPADGTYTIQAWLPAAPNASSFTNNAVYQIVSGSTVLYSTTLNQTAASGGDQWHAIATLSLTAASNPYLQILNAGSGLLNADAIYVTSAALYNNGAPAPSVTIAAMDGILLQRQTPVAAPSTTLNNVVSAATWQPVVSPSSLVSLVGSGFGTSNETVSLSSITGNQLPTQMGGISATINGNQAAVTTISPNQAVLVAPDDTTVGTVPVQLTVNGSTYSGSVTLQKFAPALFRTISGGIAYSQAFHASGAAVTTSAPANPGETITLLATGLGATSPATPAVQTVVGWAPVAMLVTVTIGGAAATVQFAAKVSPGVYQISVTIPSSAAAGNQTVQVGVSGFSSPSGVFLPVV